MMDWCWGWRRTTNCFSRLSLALLQVPVAGHLDGEVGPLGARPLAHLRVPRLVRPLQRLAAQRLARAPLLLQLGRLETLGLSNGQGIETIRGGVGPLVDHPGGRRLGLHCLVVAGLRGGGGGQVRRVCRARRSSQGLETPEVSRSRRRSPNENPIVPRGAFVASWKWNLGRAVLLLPPQHRGDRRKHDVTSCLLLLRRACLLRSRSAFHLVFRIAEN